MPLILTSLLLCRAMVSLGTVMPATASASEAPENGRFSEASSIPRTSSSNADATVYVDDDFDLVSEGSIRILGRLVVRDRDPADQRLDAPSVHLYAPQCIVITGEIVGNGRHSHSAPCSYGMRRRARRAWIRYRARVPDESWWTGRSTRVQPDSPGQTAMVRPVVRPHLWRTDQPSSRTGGAPRRGSGGGSAKSVRFDRRAGNGGSGGVVAELAWRGVALDDAERAERVTHLRRLAGYAAKKAAPSSEDSNSPALECAPGDAGAPA